MSAWKSAGFDAAQCIEAGYKPKDLLDAGFTNEELLASGMDADALKSAGAARANCAPRASRRTASRRAATTRARCTTRAIPVGEAYDAGFTLAELRVGGYEPAQMARLDFTPKSARGAGFTLGQLVDIFDAVDCEGAFTAAELAPYLGPPCDVPYLNFSMERSSFRRARVVCEATLRHGHARRRRVHARAVRRRHREHADRRRGRRLLRLGGTCGRPRARRAALSCCLCRGTPMRATPTSARCCSAALTPAVAAEDRGRRVRLPSSHSSGELEEGDITAVVIKSVAPGGQVAAAGVKVGAALKAVGADPITPGMSFRERTSEGRRGETEIGNVLTLRSGRRPDSVTTRIGRRLHRTVWEI